VEFCSKYTALSSDTLIAFDNVVGKDPACEVLSTKNVAYEEGICATPVNPICLDVNKKSSVFKVTAGKTYRFCRQIITNGGDPDCLGKTYQTYCAFLWKVSSGSSFSKTICNGESVKIGTISYNTTGIYTNTITGSTGCDSTVTVNLTVLPAANSTVTTSICNGDSYIIGANKYDKSGTFTSAVKTKNGCDSTITLNLTVLPAKIAAVSKTICFGEKITIGTNTYDKSGVYTTSVKTNGLSCDSTISLTLTVLSKIGSTLQKTICNGQTYVSNGNPAYDKSGKYDEKYKAKNGCDSTYTVDLTVLPVLKSTVNASICDGTSYTIANQTFDKPGTYPIVAKNKIGCDSTITLILKTSNKVEINTVKTICQGQSIKIGNTTYTTSTTTEITLPNNGNGCDTLIKLNLTVNEKTKSSITKTICFGQNELINGIEYKVTTKQTIIFPNKKGCDSTVTLDLTVLPESKEELLGSICSNGGSIKIKDVTYTKKGSYPLGKTGKDKNGCDITTTVIIVEDNIPAAAGTQKSPSCAGKTDGSYEITSPTGAEYTYVWSDPKGNGTKITGVKAGTYTVTITTTKSACSQVFPVVIEDPRLDIKENITSAACNDASNGAITITSPSEAGTIYNWASGLKTATISNLKKGTYAVTVTDKDGCVANKTITVGADAEPTLSVTPKNVTVNIGETASFTLNISNIVNPVITWTPTANVTKVGNAYLIKPTGITEPQVYTFTVKDANGCSATTTASVLGQFKIPAVFTPDGDIEVNKIFTPVKDEKVTSNLVYTTFLVFNRWGEIVYDNPKDHKWNGMFKDKKCPTDVYIYKIQVQDLETVFSGEITLLR
uniref:T9SS type B sorting domain-containing protein n=1 Tax=Flavobacterium sp. TaxID=239 RepID=UPI003751B760